MEKSLIGKVAVIVRVTGVARHGTAVQFCAVEPGRRFQSSMGCSTLTQGP